MMNLKAVHSPSLFQKFSLTIIILGLLPMFVLTTFIANNMIRNYQEALSSQYEQAAEYVNTSLVSMLDLYNSISKMPYYYNYSIEGNQVKNYMSFDHFRQIVSGERYEESIMESERKKEMENFLKYLESVDGYINSAHFIAVERTEETVNFHHSNYSTFFKDDRLFQEKVSYDKLDTTSNKMLLIPTHETGYFSSMNEPVFTIARNYFDLRGAVGNTPYVGTLFLDINLKRLDKIFRLVKFGGNEVFYVVNEENDCFYSNNKEKTGLNLSDEIGNLNNTSNQLVVQTKENDYGLKVIVVMNTEIAFGAIRRTQSMMYLFVFISVIALFIGSIFFSKKLTKPMREMMKQMELIEKGNFDITLNVNSKDEIGVLSERFNQMSSALNEYINQSYLAKIRQNEAELTALKSQIYPHFLYNTLEIIRMTALEDEGREKVPQMIEALSEQIHYIIGPMQDMVPLDQELHIIGKYVYLLNCRIAGKVQLIVEATNTSSIIVPKLILQPIIENAYVHGIKPKTGKGSILVQIKVEKDLLEISVMDNGIGMDAKALDQIKELLRGDAPGIKNEYNWQSIGLKNVHDRIRYLYGEVYGIEITSTPLVGTMVSLLLPLREETYD